MEYAKVNGVELEYEVVGSGEPVLLISPVLADGFLPLMSEPTLTDRCQLIRYHKRGWVGSTHTPPPVSITDHADDAAALLDHLGVARAHVAGHSSGAAVAAQMALDHPESVHTLILLELSLFSVPSGAAFFQQAAAAINQPVLSVLGSQTQTRARRTRHRRIAGATQWPEPHSGANALSVDAVSSCDELVREHDLDEADGGADDHAEQSVEEKGGHYWMLEELGVVDRVQRGLLDLERQRDEEQRQPEM